MRIAPVVLLLCATSAWAQAPATKAPPATKPSQAPAAKAAPATSPTCTECGVIRTVQRVTKSEPPAPTEAAKPSGLVASIPLGGGKPKVGSSTRVGGDQELRFDRWEVTVRYDDGRYTMVTLDEPGPWREGDKVRVDRGKLVAR
jgi:hypothetical protein